MRWTVVIAVRALPSAKSRLVAATRDAEGHRALVEAIRADTVAAAVAAPGVARVLLVTDHADPRLDQPGTTAVVQVSPGLNGALRDAAELAATRWPDDGVAALVGDLPALRPELLATALASAAAFEHAFVADSHGTGTTLLTAHPGQALRPAFGPRSARLHAAFATALGAAAELRADVDTPDDLAAAVALRVGPITSELLARPGGPCSPAPGIVQLMTCGRGDTGE